MVALVWMGSQAAWAGWVQRNVEEETVQSSEAQEVRQSTVHTSFDFSDPALLEGHTRLVVTCERWESQMVQIAQVIIKEKLRAGEVVKTKRKLVGNPRTVARDTPHTKEDCGEESVAGAQVELFGRVVELGPDGTWSVARSELRTDQLTRLSRGSGSVEVRSDHGTQTLPFPPEAELWAARAKTQANVTQTQRAETQQRTDDQSRQRLLAQLPDRLQQYQGPWELAWEHAPVDGRYTVTARQQAETRVATKQGSALPALVARCGDDVDLFVELDTRVQDELGLRELVTVMVRVDGDDPQELRVTRSGDREAVFFDEPRRWLDALASADRFFFRFTPHRATPVDTTFALDGLKDVWSMIQVACPI
ncbi:MAG: hypothetical protein KTR31_02820 [Myxococcales bacterium]|nr:hypothetical protein [Myxococcales bacterium]